MAKLQHLFQKNRDWAKSKLNKDPKYFSKTADSQSPPYLWIGCSDSRVLANEIIGLEPGELFVHRNIANLFPHTDFNCLSVLEYAVNMLKVEHVIVCGHYGCGGVKAAMEDHQLGLVDNWLRNIRDVYQKSKEELEQIPNQEDRYKRLVELNVKQQVLNVCHTTIVQSAWNHSQSLSVHGWVYDLSTGTLKDLDVSVSDASQVESTHRTQ